MSNRRIVLIDEKGKRLGTLMIAEACFIVEYEGAFFYRTATAVKLHHAHNALSIIFQQTEPYSRKRLDPI